MLHFLGDGDLVSHKIVCNHFTVLAEQLLLESLFGQDLHCVYFFSMNIPAQSYDRKSTTPKLLFELILVNLFKAIEGTTGLG